MSRQLGISRSTLRQAINKMVFEGLLIRKKGVGTVVADTAITSKAGNWLSFSQEMKAGDPILKRKRYVYDRGGRPVEWNVGYYRADSFVYTIESERDM